MGTVIDDFRAWTELRMKQRRLSHAQLALKCGIDRSTVTRILRGTRRPTLDVAVRIVNALSDPTNVAAIDQIRHLATAPERVEAALRSDPLLDPMHVDALMRQYLERRAA